MKKTIQSLLVVIGLAFGYAPTVGASLLFNNYVEEGTAGPSSYTVGNEFTVGAQALNVTKLGVFAGTGVFQDTPVGIWQVSDGALVGSTIVPPNSLEGVVPPVPVIRLQNWYFVEVTPFTLAANTVYRIGTQNLGSDMGWGGTFDAGTGIASVTPGSVWSPLFDWNFTYPADSDGMLFMAANAEIAPVPEPAEWTMLLAGLLVFGFIARRRKGLAGGTAVVITPAAS
jgi:PEP-CTERM motif